MDTPPYTGLAMLLGLWYTSFTITLLPFLKLSFRFSRITSGIPIIITTTINRIMETAAATTITFLLVPKLVLVL